MAAERPPTNGDASAPSPLRTEHGIRIEQGVERTEIRRIRGGKRETVVTVRRDPSGRFADRVRLELWIRHNGQRDYSALPIYFDLTYGTIAATIEALTEALAMLRPPPGDNTTKPTERTEAHGADLLGPRRPARTANGGR